MSDKEVELKFVITADIKKKIIDYFNAIPAISTTCSRLIDTYYIPYFRPFEIDGKTMECVRIRETDNSCVLGYKKIHRESTPVYCDEYETEVSNKDQTEKFLYALGFETELVIDKTRTTYHLKNFEVALDSVKNLGELLEVELVNENDSVEDILSFVNQFGLTKNDVTYEGIIVLMKKALAKK